MLASRRGASSLALLIFAAAFATVSMVFVTAKFHPNDGSGNGFFWRASATALKTLENMFSPQKKAPMLEINLADSETPAENSVVKNPQPPAPATPQKNSASSAGKSAAILPAAVPQNETSAPTFSSQEKTEKQISECDFAKTGEPNHKIIFSEINWVGSKKSPNDEWMEIKNNSGYDIGLGGWQIMSADGNIKIILPGEDKIPSGGLYLLERTDDDSAPGAVADAIYSGTLSNNGTILKIFEADCSLTDEIDASKKWPAGDTSSRRSMERSFLDFSWHTSATDGGTPKTENTAAFSKKESGTSQPAPDTETDAQQNNQQQSSSPQNQQTQQAGLHILIAEIQTTGGPGKTTNDYVKIFNPNVAPFNLKGYRLVKRTKTGTSDTSLKSWTSDTLIPAGGSYIWANSSFTSLSPAPDTTTSGSIANDNGIAIRQGPEDSGTIIDAVGWGAFQNALAEGGAYPQNPAAGQILYRKSANGTLQDTNDNQNDFELR